ncbi:MAG: zinc ribbon domain-containing protein [Anaerolineae bacterium]|nr:zinc ribbon domain-containing protein [Phycisphaerae bacterium]
MPRDDDDLDESEFPDESDMDDDPDGPATIDCPYCRREVHYDTDICPHCGKYISKEDAPQQRSWIWFVAIALVVVCTVLALLRLL